jgi:hypothetical protein
MGTLVRMKKVRVLACGATLAAVLAVTACSGGDEPETSPATTTTSAPERPAAEARRVIVAGRATLDGEPVDSRWVGAVVLDDGLVTPCQTALPPVADGRYSVSVFTDAASAGCGTVGSDVALWIFANNEILYSTNTLPWPEDEQSQATFDATYAAAEPGGATPEVAQFQGGAFAADGTALRAGTVVEAYVGDTRCGVASVRVSTQFRGYIISVVGPDSIEGCTRDAPIEFRLDGEPATPTDVMNTPPGQDDTLDLTVA